MARKKKPPEHENHERWLVSYADFVTLLFATFTALFAMSNRDLSKLAEAARSIKVAFGGSSALFSTNSHSGGSGGGPSSLLPPIPAATPKATPQGTPPPQQEADGGLFSGKTIQPSDGDPLATPTPAVTATPSPTPSPTPTPDVLATPTPMPGSSEGGGNEAMAAEIKELIKNIGLNEIVAVREEKRGTVISLGEAAFFDQGGIEVLPTCINQLDKIVNALRGKDYDIRVEGHTDNVPVRSGRIYQDNFELSTLRASRIIAFMIQKYHFDPKLLSAAGYGDARPIGPNTTAEGRQKNRRVDIVILNERAKANEPR